MRNFLIEVRRGLVLGSFAKRGSGWSYMPHTCGHRSSRKAHATMAGASLRYQTATSKIIEALDVPDAARQAKALREAYDRGEPCTPGCQHFRTNGTCARGAAPELARNLGQCAKYEEDPLWTARKNQPHVTAEQAAEQRRRLNEAVGAKCPKHGIALTGVLCLECEAEIDAAIMPTIKDQDRP